MGRKKRVMRCPYCKLPVPHGEQIVKRDAAGNDDDFCPHCGRRIIYGMPIHRPELADWSKP
jgi:DNA-directed RNA polymerase subunit RPC12/RpoP